MINIIKDSSPRKKDKNDIHNDYIKEDDDDDERPIIWKIVII